MQVQNFIISTFKTIIMLLSIHSTLMFYSVSKQVLYSYRVYQKVSFQIAKWEKNSWNFVYILTAGARPTALSSLRSLYVSIMRFFSWSPCKAIRTIRGHKTFQLFKAKIGLRTNFEGVNPKFIIDSFFSNLLSSLPPLKGHIIQVFDWGANCRLCVYLWRYQKSCYYRGELGLVNMEI